MTYVLHGTPEDVGRIEKGTSILFQELHICPKEVPLQIEVRFRNTDTLSMTKRGKHYSHLLSGDFPLFSRVELDSSPA